MAAINANGICIEYATYGSAQSPPLVMVNGLSNQLVDWPQGLISTLAEHYYVVIFDNRDSGLSSKMGPDDAYSLYDLADDTVALANALGLNEFNLLGFSMGGMISQIIALKYPGRVLSLVSLMSSDGKQAFASRPDAMAAIRGSTIRIDDEAERRALWVDFALRYRGSEHASCRDELEEGVSAALERNYCPEGIARQLYAVENTPDRDISKITAPTLIIHGQDDPCILLHHAENAHRLIPGSELEVFQGLGHEIPSQVSGVIGNIIKQHLDKAS